MGHRTISGFLCVLVFSVLSLNAYADSPPIAAEDPVLIKRAQKLEENLRCLVCQNQSIAESTADLANDLRHQVRTQLKEGKSEQEIIDYMVARYGDFVLYDPPFKRATLLLWLGPLLLLLAAMGGFVLTLKNRRSQIPVQLNAEEHARASELLSRSPDSSMGAKT